MHTNKDKTWFQPIIDFCFLPVGCGHSSIPWRESALDAGQIYPNTFSQHLNYYPTVRKQTHFWRDSYLGRVR